MLEKRLELKKLYPGSRWAEKVDKMLDRQIVAIYLRLKTQGRLP